MTEYTTPALTKDQKTNLIENLPDFYKNNQDLTINLLAKTFAAIEPSHPDAPLYLQITDWLIDRELEQKTTAGTDRAHKLMALRAG